MIYPVTVDWIPGLPQIPFKDGIGCYKRVVMHQTANPNDTARSERNWEAKNFNNAFVHEFIDPNEIIQVANPQYLAYGAGAIANKDSIHLELCSAKTQAEFDRSFDMWCQRAAVHLAANKLGVSPAQKDGSGTLWSHLDVTEKIGGTTHTDPIEYLSKWGKKWQDVIDRVKQHYDAVTQEEPKMCQEDANKIIGFLQAAWKSTEDKEARTEYKRLADEVRKAAGIPTT